jgi:hypothetical protein
MKKALVLLLAAVMVFSLVGILNVASPLKAAAESTNLALNKPVTEELEDGTTSMGDPYWGIDYLTDGSRFDTTTYDGANQPVDTRYGWYVVKVGEDPMNASAVIDLQAAYDVCRIRLYTEYHFLGTKFPNTYDVYLSADGSNWTKVISESGRNEFLSHALEYEFDKVNARYVKFTIVYGNDIVADTDDGGFVQYAGLGEIEVYDTYTTGNIAAFKTATQNVDAETVTTWVLGNSGQWDVHALTGPSVPYAFGPYNMTGWIAVASKEDSDMRLDVDLHGKYTINKIELVPMPWSNTGNDDAGWYFPNTYEVLVSEDGTNWTSVYKGENESTVGVKGATRTIEFSEKDANFVRVVVNKGTATGNGDFWTGLGGIKVYGSYTLPPETQPETEPANFELHGASFDTIYVNDVMNFGQADGAASDKLDGVGRTIDGSDGSVQTIRLRGWIGFETEIAELGYQINGKNTFGDYKVAPEAAVTDPANGGQYATRFDMTIDVSNLKGTNKIVAVAKLADGTIVKIDENVSANGAGTTPNTSFTYVGPAEENVTTGDMTVAMFAVLAVLALGAVAVFAKKRAF